MKRRKKKPVSKKKRNNRHKFSKRTRMIMLAGAVVLAVAVIIAGVQIHKYFSIPVSEGTYAIKGVDLSSYQGNVDWDVFSRQGIAFAYIKATEGSSHVDSKFKTNWENASKTNLRFGAYHFMSLETPGHRQAANFIKNVDAKGDMLPPVIDVEFYGSFENNHPGASAVYAILDPLIKDLKKEYGMEPVLYTTTYIYQNYLSGRYDNDIWISDPEMAQPLSDGRKWTFCQYSFEGVLKGYSGNLKHIDLDVFYGSRMDFFNYN